MPFVSAAELIPNCSFLVSVLVSPEDLCSFAGQLTISSRFTSPTTVISHLKYSKPLTDRRCQQSRYHQLQHLSNVLQNNGARKAKMDIFLHVLLDWGHSAQQDQSAARQELEASPGFLLRSTKRSPCASHLQCNNGRQQHQDAFFFL